MTRRVSRRALLIGSAGAGLAVVGAGVGISTGALPGAGHLHRALADEGPAGVIPDVPPGRTTLEEVVSRARGRSVGLFTAVPDGHGDGAGLPVCFVLHGASATTADFGRFGLAQFVTAAVRAGAPPFVLVGADGGETYWSGGPGDDPQAMLRDELPLWSRARGFDPSRLALYGWSMGGFGVLRFAELNPRRARAVAALSPAVRTGDAVFTGASALVGSRTALWCGDSDALSPAVHDFAAVVPGAPAVAAWDKGAHTRAYWNRVTPAAFAFIGSSLRNS